MAYASEPLVRARYEIYDRTGCQLLAQWLQVQATFGAAPGSVGAAEGSALESSQYRQAG